MCVWGGGGGEGGVPVRSCTLFSFKLFDTVSHEVLFAICNDRLKKFEGDNSGKTLIPAKMSDRRFSTNNIIDDAVFMPS